VRAAIFQGVGQKLAVENVADPTPAPNQIILSISHAGICGSDLHMTQSTNTPVGLILGHEFSGEIAAMGANVTDRYIGERVTALPLTPCRHCDACDEGLPALCHSNLFLGCSLDSQGAYAEYLAVRADMVQPLPAGVSFADGAMVEPLAVGHHIVSLAELPHGASVLILGAGPIGSAAALFARHAGAAHVVVSEPSMLRRQQAKQMGATAVIDPSNENVAEAFARLTGENKPRFILECVGIKGMLHQAVQYAGIRARIVVAGVLLEDDLFTPIIAMGKELTIRYSQAYQETDFEAVIAALAKHHQP
jgi:(R,R)-butanediol dehydrogenase / meso-butanediol dehydrogenase / diacetyl reductase